MFIKIYLITLPVFLAIDLLWLGLIAKKFYREQIGFLMKSNVNWFAAIVFYLLFVAGLVIFAISPSLEKKSWLNAIWLAALFGLFTYSTYDLTNLATLKEWPFLLTVVDILWGMFLSIMVTLISYFIALKIGL